MDNLFWVYVIGMTLWAVVMWAVVIGFLAFGLLG